MRGRFIAIEGLDGSGGTTQVEILRRWLETQNLTAVKTYEPSSGPAGQLIRQALRGEVDLGDRVLPYLYAADRRDHVDTVIEPALKRGDWVISDRYLASSLAYQSSAMLFEHVAELNAHFPLPDLTIYLDLDPERCIERIKVRGVAPDRFEQLDRLKVIQEAYRKALAWRSGHVVVIDADRPVAEVAHLIAEAVRKTTEEHSWLGLCRPLPRT